MFYRNRFSIHLQNSEGITDTPYFGWLAPTDTIMKENSKIQHFGTLQTPRV